MSVQPFASRSVALLSLYADYGSSGILFFEFSHVLYPTCSQASSCVIMLVLGSDLLFYLHQCQSITQLYVILVHQVSKHRQMQNEIYLGQNEPVQHQVLMQRYSIRRVTLGPYREDKMHGLQSDWLKHLVSEVTGTFHVCEDVRNPHLISLKAQL